MGDILSSLASGFVSTIGKVFGSPLEFLSGKSCSSVCGPTWDFLCYIENFCVANLLKMAMVLVLSYFVLLFLYIVHKIGICGCVCRGFCRMIWTCLASYCYACEYCCSFIWIKLHRLKRRRRRNHRRRDLEEEFESEGGGSHWYGSSSHSSNVTEHVELRSSRWVSRRQRRNYRGSHMRKALRTRSRGIRVRSGRELVYGKHRRKSSKFVHKERKHIGGRRW